MALFLVLAFVTLTVVVRWHAARPEPVFVVEHELEIAASPEQVWGVLADFEAYPDWNPYVTHIEAEPVAGEPVHITIIQANWKKAFSFTARLETFEPGRELGWRGTALFKGVHDTHHYLRLEALGDDGTRLHHAEEFGGLLPKLIYDDAQRANTRDAFRAMNEALAARAEGR